MRTMQNLADRIRAEYLEMPGLRLTSEHIQRLCGLEHTVCALVLDSLVQSRFLHVTTDGYYARVSDRVVRRPVTPRPRCGFSAFNADS